MSATDPGNSPTIEDVRHLYALARAEGRVDGINEERARVQKLAATYLRPVIGRSSPIDIEGSIQSFLDLFAKDPSQ
jgi:hypothetical protein